MKLNEIFFGDIEMTQLQMMGAEPGRTTPKLIEKRRKKRIREENDQKKE